MRRSFRLLLFLWMLWPTLALAGFPDTPGTYDLRLIHRGVDRTYRLVLPPQYDGRTRLPLMMVFHGGGGNGRSMERMTGFSAKARTAGFIAVYPDGSGRFERGLFTWNVGNCCGYALEHRTDDVGFIRELVKVLQSRLAVDERRIYAAGLSNGGMMVHRLACEMADTFAAVADVAGAMNVQHCQPAKPVAVLVIHGDADRHVLYQGGRPQKTLDRRHPRVDRPVAYAENYWTLHNGCRGEPAITKHGPAETRTHRSCRGQTAVSVVTLRGFGHAWPGGVKLRPQGDDPGRAISATDVIWNFCRKLSKN